MKNPSLSSGAKLYIIFLILAVIGLATLYSAETSHAYFYAQMKRLLLGAGIVFLVGRYVNPRIFLDYAKPLYWATTISLALVLIIGSTAGGSQRWLNIGPIGIQPSEFAKIVAAITVAEFFEKSSHTMLYRLQDLAPILAKIGVFFILIFLQPDLGTGGICILIAAPQILLVRLDTKNLSWIIGASLLVAALAWIFFLHDYQKLRILNVLNPDLDPQGSGYNSIQSMVAIGSGGLFGKGFLLGSQSKLQFLPARHTDFIFSVFAEEWGFVGCVFVVLTFTALGLIVLDIARRAHDTYSSLLAVGLGALLIIEYLINVAMVIGLFPVVGMPLPFISYGGSAVIAMAISIGLLVSIDRNSTKRKSFQGLETNSSDYD
jgi:rod shape determining protein RodA